MDPQIEMLGKASPLRLEVIEVAKAALADAKSECKRLGLEETHHTSVSVGDGDLCIVLLVVDKSKAQAWPTFAAAFGQSFAENKLARAKLDGRTIGRAESADLATDLSFRVGMNAALTFDQSRKS